MQANLKENYKWVVGKYVKFDEYSIMRIDNLRYIPINTVEDYYKNELDPNEAIYVDGPVAHLYTVRDGKYLQDAVDWFRYNHINLYSVNYNPEPVSSSPKLYCDYYIDDRNIGTPLTDKGYVDWNKMLVLLKQKNLL